MEPQKPRQKLMPVSYFDLKAEVRLEAYADTIVFGKEKNGTFGLAAIRFGGYPESVRGMSDAIYGGGSITAEIGGDRFTLNASVKQYRREISHDGVYAEAALFIQDDQQQAGDKPDETNGGPRKAYIFCERGDDERLFEELDRKTAVPLIPEFRAYVLNELKNRNILKPLTVVSYRERFDAWVLELDAGEKNIVQVVNDGLKSGEIAIPGQHTGGLDTAFDGVKTVSQYLNTFGVTIAERIKGQFDPLYDPANQPPSEEILTVNETISANAGYSLFGAQLAVAESLKRCMARKKFALCVAECGSGKTKIGAAALHALQQSKQPGKHFNIILCPSHITRKWVREIEETLPDTFAVVIGSITDFDRAYATYARGNKSCYAVMSKEKARDGYMKRPAVVLDKRNQRFICPDCGGTVMMDIIDCGSKYRVEADQFYFQRENRKNHKCEHCGTVLWTMLVSGEQSEWVKIADYGFIHRRMAHQHLATAKSAKTKVAIESVARNPDGIFASAGAYSRFPLSTYIKRKYRGRIDGAIIDELHQFNNDSGQGDAMGELFQAANKVIGLTGTLVNGYSSGVFHLLYRVMPSVMKQDGKDYERPDAFNSEYGVTESVYELDAPAYNSNRRAVRRKVRERQLPGVSPLVYSRFLLDAAAFLSLEDMGRELPEYEEFPVQLEMAESVRLEYKRLEDVFRNVMRSEKRIAKKVMSAFLGLLTVYPDQPYDQKPIIHPIEGDELVTPEDCACLDDLHEKDIKLLEIVKRKIVRNERVLVYTSWTRIDTQNKLLKLLTENNIRASVLTVSVPPNKREDWVQKQVSSDVQALITNPALVETGLDLNDFTTLIYYNIAYNLFTLRQSSRRSWRINQKASRIEVYFLYYRETMQHRAIRLMASKLAVAGIIEGNLSDEGLAAMSDCQDLTSALARELTHGIKNEVEDLGAAFKKMAILKPEKRSETLLEPVQPASVTVQHSEPKEYLFYLKPPTKPKKKAVIRDERQISLFELVGISA